MKFIPFKFLLFSSVIVLLSSCLGKTDAVVLSSDASFISLTFTANDSIPYLSTAVFTLEDSTIVNLDSLPFNTRIDSVFPRFTFATTSGSILIYPSGSKKDTVVITGKDTIDFRQPVRLINYASDAKTPSKKYTIKVNVHKVNPESYVWSKVNGDLYPGNATNQKAIVLNENIFYYLNDGANNITYSSLNGYTWNTFPVNNLPANVSLRSMVQFNGKLFVTHGGDKIYTSVNGIDWSINNYVGVDYSFKSLLFGLKDSIHAITQSKTDQKYHFASSKDGVSWKIQGATLDAKFPVSDFDALSFSSRTGKAKAIIIGGLDSNGALLNTRWSTENGLYWVDFSLENRSLDTLAAGASVVAYTNKLLLFGVRNDKSAYVRHFKQSIDEGLTWQTPDSTFNFLPATLGDRSFQSVVVVDDKTNPLVVDKANRIFVIGGKTITSVLSDVWTGKLNKKGFTRP